MVFKILQPRYGRLARESEEVWRGGKKKSAILFAKMCLVFNSAF